MKAYRELTQFETDVILNRATEVPFSGDYVNEFSDGKYYCRQCGATLYSSESKFHSGCGWPSFDSDIDGAVAQRPDSDGNRTEIVCSECDGHLGHVFQGEGFTPTDLRHCVNSVSLLFVPAARVERVQFAGGCFWGIEHQFQQVDGVLETTAGYTGGSTDNPGYSEVCTGATGHAEAVEITFDTSVISFEELARLFFEIHDPTTQDRQGPDIGTQYRSAVFYNSDEQKEVLENLIDILKQKGYDTVTQVIPMGDFFPAEENHQDYFRKNADSGICHARTNRFH